jgi:PIN domain nuclease of toxin-antitoxin system
VIVLDASALVALWRKEPGWERVAQDITSSAVSSTNLAEALSKFVEDGGDADLMATETIKSGCEVVALSIDHAINTAKLRPLTRSVGLSLGDRLCLALAIERNCAVLTADRNWGRLNIGVPVQLIR